MNLDKYNEKYVRPEVESKFVDVTKGEVVEKSEIPEIEVIKAIAKKVGVTISDPKKDCKSCYGRGKIGNDAKDHHPIPCPCLFRNSTDQAQKYREAMASQIYAGMNREKKRQMAKAMKQRFKQIKRNQNVRNQSTMAREVPTQDNAVRNTPEVSENQVHQNNQGQVSTESSIL